MGRRRLPFHADLSKPEEFEAFCEKQATIVKMMKKPGLLTSLQIKQAYDKMQVDLREAQRLKSSPKIKLLRCDLELAYNDPLSRQINILRDSENFDFLCKNAIAYLLRLNSDEATFGLRMGVNAFIIRASGKSFLVAHERLTEVVSCIDHLDGVRLQIIPTERQSKVLETLRTDAQD